MMITIEQIKNQLIRLGFKLNQQDINQPNKFRYEKNDKFPRLIVEIDNYQFGVNGILESDNFITCSLQNQTKPRKINYWWNLFLQLVEENAK